jgi:hypothetical protein
MGGEAIMNCEICNSELAVRWSDTHGVGACITCGLPYTVLHYQDDKPIDKAPEIAIKPEWIPIGKRYWEETKRRVFPGAYDMGILGGRESTYSGATREDMQNWEEWLEAHEADLPKPEKGGEAAP